MKDHVLKSLLDQVKGNLGAYHHHLLGQCVSNVVFIDDVKQLSLTNGMKNADEWKSARLEMYQNEEN